MMKSTSHNFSITFIAALLWGLFNLQNNIASAATADEMLTQLGFSEQEKQDVLKGKLIQREAKERSDQELAVTLSFWIKKDAEQLRKNFIKGLSIDNNEDVISHQFINPDASFPVLQLKAAEQKEVSKLLAVETGSTFNLSADEIKAFNALDKTDSAALKQLQSLLESRYQTYRQGGFAAIAPYQRSAKKQYQLAEYFSKNRQAILPALSKSFPEFYKALNNYPQYKPAGLQDRFILLKLTIEGRPAFALEHRMAMHENGAELMASSYFYVSHTLNGQQGLGMLFPNGEDSIAVVITRASSDAVAGFGSSTKHFIGRRMLADALSGFYESVQKKHDR